MKVAQYCMDKKSTYSKFRERKFSVTNMNTRLNGIKNTRKNTD